MTDEETQEAAKQAIVNTINDKDVKILCVDWLIVDADTDQCQMTVTFDLKDRAAMDTIEDAYERAMGIIK
jgi:ribosome-binding factor A